MVNELDDNAFNELPLLLEYVRALKGSELLDDDFSMVEVRF